MNEWSQIYSEFCVVVKRLNAIYNEIHFYLKAEILSLLHKK